jgi:hypothetical protein
MAVKPLSISPSPAGRDIHSQPAQNQDRLTSLPLEIIAIIGSHLSYADADRLLKTCTALNSARAPLERPFWKENEKVQTVFANEMGLFFDCLKPRIREAPLTAPMADSIRLDQMEMDTTNVIRAMKPSNPIKTKDLLTITLIRLFLDVPQNVLRELEWSLFPPELSSKLTEFKSIPYMIKVCSIIKASNVREIILDLGNSDNFIVVLAASELVNWNSDDPFYIPCIIAIIRSLCNLGHFLMVVEFIEVLPKESAKNSARETIAYVFINEKHFHWAFKMVNQISDEKEKNNTLDGIIYQLCDGTYFSEAVIFAHQISDLREKSWQLNAISYRLANLGRFSESIDVAEMILDEQLRNRTYEDMIYCAQQIADPEKKRAILHDISIAQAEAQK